MSVSSDVVFGSLNSRTDLGLTFTHADKAAPEVYTEYVSVPGRYPVDLSELGLGRPIYQNRTITVEFEYMGADWEDERELVYASLHGRKMNVRFLNDSDWYYVGRCTVACEVNGSTQHYTVTITAEPWKYIYSETPTTLTSAGTITNPTEFYSQPLICVYGSGSGTITVGNYTITISSIDSYVYIDSLLMDCYKGLTNKNGTVQASSFPVLEPGDNGISFSGGVTSVVITGRWRTL